MSSHLTFIFTIITAICSVLLVTSFIHYLLQVYQTQRKKNTIDPLVKTCATISLFGYTIYVFISFILHLIASLWYIPSVNIHYTKFICQLQTFNIVFFMTGKLAMYFFFMSLVHVAFSNSSSLAYPPKIIVSLAVVFFAIMCIIGGFYMLFLFFDFAAVESIYSPDDCQQFKVSTSTSIIIWIGCSCDAMWIFTCLFLFLLRLKRITDLMEKQAVDSRLDVVRMESKYSMESVTHTHTNTNPTEPTPTISPNNSGTSNVVDSNNHLEVHNQQGSIMQSIRLSFDKIKKKVGNKKGSKQDMVQQYLPIMLKLSILSTWCALSTITLGFGLWTIYPTISSVIDSTINAICVYLSFGFTNKLYQRLCLSFLLCGKCDKHKSVVKGAGRNGSSHPEQSVLG
eukprot:20_1